MCQQNDGIMYGRHSFCKVAAWRSLRCSKLIQSQPLSGVLHSNVFQGARMGATSVCSEDTQSEQTQNGIHF